MELESLLRRFVEAGDSAAMDTLVKRTQPCLLAVARRIGAPQDAVDSVQAAYHSLLRRAGTPFAAPVLPWLLTTVVRIAYRCKAKNARETALADRLAREPASDDPVAAAGAAERATILRAEVARLPAKYRDAIVLHHLEGLTTAEAARLLDAPRATVKARLQRGRRLLRGRLSPRLGAALMAVPWWIADHARAATLALAGGGAVMSKQIGGVVVVVALLVGGYVAWRARGGGDATDPGRSDGNRAVAVKPPPDPENDLHASDPAPDTPASTPGDVGIEKARADRATLRVRIVDDRDRPVPFASVLLRGAGQGTGEREAIMGRDARAVFEDLVRHVSWELLVRYMGYTPYHQPVDLTSGEELVVKLARPAVRILHVTVVDAGGAALAGHHVWAAHDGGTTQNLTNEEGYAEMAVRGDVWHVRAAPPAETLRWVAEARELPVSRSEVRLVAPDETEIRGRVLRPDGKPYATAMLRVERERKLVSSEISNPSGAFVIRLPVGAPPVNIVFAGAQIERNGTIMFYEQVAEAGRLDRVAPGTSAAVLRTRKVKRDRNLVVHVQTDERAPVAGAHVAALIETAWLGRSDGRTGKNGEIRLLGLAQRGFAVEVEPPGGAALMRRRVRVPVEGARLAVTLLRAAPFAGRVRFRGAALHGAQISVKVDGVAGRPVRVDARGRFRTAIPVDTRHDVVFLVTMTGEFGLRQWAYPLLDRAVTEIELDRASR